MEPMTSGDAGITRRAAVHRVVALMGGLALVAEDRVFAVSADTSALERAMAQGAGAFTAAEIALLDEIAETILPETSTPGAKAARTGAFMALMVTDAYNDRDQAGVSPGHGHARGGVPHGDGHRVHGGHGGPAYRPARGPRP